MAINVFTNVSSLNAQRNLQQTASNSAKTLQRLSSGMRINTAADDAAGMAISNGLISKSKGYNQAIRNAGDGLSLMGTAESAMVEQTNILQRMREISVQAASDNNNNTNRSDLNNEASQLKSELERIARTTEFNGLNLLDGTFQNKDLQVGAMATSNDRINVSFSSTRAADIGSGYKVTSGSVTANAMDSGDVTITKGSTTYTIGAATADGVSSTNADRSALAKANAINAQSHLTGVTAEASTSVTGAAQTAATVSGLTINGTTIADVTLATTTDGGLAAAINAQYSKTGVTATLNNDTLTLKADDGRNITVGGTVTNSGLTAQTSYGTMTLRSSETFTVGGATVADAGLSAGAATLASSENVNAIDLSSKGNAQLAIKIVDTALGQLNSRRGQIGALTNRLNTTINNLSAAAENAEASKSRILDADFAVETASMSRNQVLQQAGIAILSQANQGPQAALSLLR